jgi:hypothetical protein
LEKRTKKLFPFAPGSGGSAVPMDESLFASFSSEKEESCFLAAWLSLKERPWLCTSR